METEDIDWFENEGDYLGCLDENSESRIRAAILEDPDPLGGDEIPF